MTIAEILNEYELTAEQVAADLRSAAQVIRTHGWTTGQFLDDLTGCVCAVGAIRIAAFGSPVDPFDADYPDRCRSYAAESIVGKHLGLDGDESLPTWNDHYCSDGEQVIRVFEETAAALESGAAS